MKRMLAYWDRTSFFLNRIVYYILLAAAVLFMLSYFVPFLFRMAQLLLVLTALGLLTDFFLLYRIKNGVEAERNLQPRLSNGDENRITISLHNHYDFKAVCSVIDELPFQFQAREWIRRVVIGARDEALL